MLVHWTICIGACSSHLFWLREAWGNCCWSNQKSNKIQQAGGPIYWVTKWAKLNTFELEVKISSIENYTIILIMKDCKVPSAHMWKFCFQQSHTTRTCSSKSSSLHMQINIPDLPYHVMCHKNKSIRRWRANLTQHLTSPRPSENLCHTKIWFYPLSRKSKILLSTTGLEKKKLEIQLVLWQSSSHMLLTLSHFLLTLVNDFVQGRSHGWEDNRLTLFLNMFNSRARTSAYKSATGSHCQSIYELNTPTQP